MRASNKISHSKSERLLRKKQVFNFDISMTLGPGQETTLTLLNRIPCCLLLPTSGLLTSSFKLLLNFDSSMIFVQGQEMTLAIIKCIPTLTSLVFCIYQLFKYQAAIVSKISIALAFSHVKAYISKIDLPIK